MLSLLFVEQWCISLNKCSSSANVSLLVCSSSYKYCNGLEPGVINRFTSLVACFVENVLDRRAFA